MPEVALHRATPPETRPAAMVPPLPPPPGAGSEAPGEEKIIGFIFLSLQNRDSPRYKTGGAAPRTKGAHGGWGEWGGGDSFWGGGHGTVGGGRGAPNRYRAAPPPPTPQSRGFYGNKKNTKGARPGGVLGVRGGGQSSRTMGSEVLAGWGGGGGARAPPGRRGSPGFTLRGRLGRRAARRSSRWVRAFRSALAGGEWGRSGVGGTSPYPTPTPWSPPQSVRAPGNALSPPT